MPYSKLGDLQTLTLSNEVYSDNPCCILTLDCCVMLMGNFQVKSYTAGNTLATLPASMRPLETIKKIAVVENLTADPPMAQAIVVITVDTSGSIKADSDISTGLLYLNGITFNVCGRYYNSTIGNNFPQGTSPLRWDGDEY